jgi:hypothetical protein
MIFLICETMRFLSWLFKNADSIQAVQSRSKHEYWMRGSWWKKNGRAYQSTDTQPQYRFVGHKFHITWPEIEPRQPWWEELTLHPFCLDPVLSGWDRTEALHVSSLATSSHISSLHVCTDRLYAETASSDYLCSLSVQWPVSSLHVSCQGQWVPRRLFP